MSLGKRLFSTYELCTRYRLSAKDELALGVEDWLMGMGDRLWVAQNCFRYILDITLKLDRKGDQLFLLVYGALWALKVCLTYIECYLPDLSSRIRIIRASCTKWIYVLKPTTHHWSTHPVHQIIPTEKMNTTTKQ